MLELIIFLFAILFFIALAFSGAIVLGIILLPLILLLLPFLFSAGIFIVLFFVTTFVLWLITENLLISFCILAVLFALIWFVGEDTATIKARLEKERLSKQNSISQ